MSVKPMILCGGAAAAAVFLAVKSELRPSVLVLLPVCAALSLLLAILLDRKRLRAVLAGVLSAGLALVLMAGYDAVFVSPVRALNGDTRQISAVLTEDADEYEDRQRARIRIVPVNDVKFAFTAYCYLPLTDTPLLAGDRVALCAEFYLPGNSEGFDRAEYQAANGCFIAARYAENDDGSAVSFDVTRDSGSLFYLPQRIARACKQTVRSVLPEREGGLLQALLLGDKSGLEDRDYTCLRKAGLSHMVAVSGLHIGFLVSFCFLIGGKRLGTLLSVPLILLFLPIAGFTPSVIRAGVMYLIAAAGFCLRRQADSLNSLFFALTLLLVLNPYAVMSISLQLSFAATLGLILFAGPMQRRLTAKLNKAPKLLRRLACAVAGAVSCSVSALVLTVPILMSAFGSVSLLSVVSNLLVLCVTAVCFIGGFALCALYPLLPGAAALLAKPLAALLRYILHVAEGIAALPFGVVNWEDGFGVIALFLFCAAVLTWLLAKKPQLRQGLAAALLIGAVGMSAYSVYDAAQHYAVTYLPCGTGQAIILSIPNEEMALIDCSGSSYHDSVSQISEWMLWNGYEQIDTLVLTALDRGHARDLPVLLEQIPVRSIIIPAGWKETKYNTEILAALEAQTAPVQTVNETLDCGDALPLTAFLITDGKLAVAIGTHTVVLHSATQKQLAAYLQGSDLQAQTAVLSQGQTEDAELLREALRAMGTQSVILQAQFEPIEQFDGIPIRSPYNEGEIRLQYERE